MMTFLLSPIQMISGQEMATIDIVKVNARYEKEAMYFYNENWKEFRKLALQKGVISGFEIHRTVVDSTNHFQLVLITKYRDSAYFAKSEENFRPIMKSVSPNGPKMLNNVERKDFLESMAGYETMMLGSNHERKKKK